MRRLVAASLVAGALAVTPGAANAQSSLPAGVFAAGVSIQGVPVGGMTATDARPLIMQQVVAPRLKTIRLQLKTRGLYISPAKLGYQVGLNTTIINALKYGRTLPATGPVNVPLVQIVRRSTLESFLRANDARLGRAAINASLSWKGTAPWVRKSRTGIGIKFPNAVNVVTAALLNRPGDIVNLPARSIRPVRSSVGTVVVVHRDIRRLYVYRDETRMRIFKVAIGTPSYPTPQGFFRVVTKQMNPTWFPPDSPWAAGLGPVPPGPGNPLGTRWIGTSAPGIGIHGTPAAWSVGTAASHGCLRMYIPDVEWLYNYVKIGTVVRIV